MLKAYLKIILLFLVSLCVLESQAKEGDGKKFTVVIDAGHGGKDIGATDNGVKEKDINLKVAKYLEALIKKKLKETSVVMTRNSDSYLTLQQRADIANKSQGDLFISIHTNSVDKKNKNRRNIEGSSVYTLGLHKDESNLEVAMRENSVIELEQDFEQKYSGFDPQRDESYIIFEMAQKKNLEQSIRFAEDVEGELVKSGRKNRGVHQAGFWVLWATSMPSVLVELDFICNPEAAKYISSDKGAKELAEAIFKAIQKYEASWRKNQNSNYNGNLSETYSEGEDSGLEETYIVLSEETHGVAKTRAHRPQENNAKKRPDVRKRRSAIAKQVSMNVSFEKSNLPSFASLTTKDRVEALENEVETIAPADLSENRAPLDKKAAKELKKKEEKRKKEEKKREEQEAKKRKRDAHNAKVNKLVTVYKIQILTSTDLLSQGNPRFCGLSPVTAFKENNLYKYYYGESSDKEELEALLADVRKKIPDAFIVSSQKSVNK